MKLSEAIHFINTFIQNKPYHPSPYIIPAIESLHAAIHDCNTPQEFLEKLRDSNYV